MVAPPALFLGLSVAWAAPAVHMQVDSEQLVVGQQVAVRVSVDASEQPVQPELVAPDGLLLQVSGAPSFSSSFSFDGQNSRRSATWTWVYGLTALEEGSYTLGPAVVGQSASNTVQVRVQAGSDQEMERLEAGLGVTQAYVGQTLVWRAKVDTQLRGQSEQWTLPPMPGLERDPLASDQTQNLVSSLNGQRVASYRAALALRVSEAGEVEGSATVFSLQVAVRNQGRIERSRQMFSSERESLLLLPQPPGQDARWSGLVGEFQVSLEPERRELALGETLSLTLRVTGDGSVAGWLPPMIKLGELQVFAELPKLRGEITEDGYLGQGERSFAVVPTEPGTLQVPALELQILDPVTGEYRLVATQPFTVRVLDGQALEPRRQSFQAAEPAQRPASQQPTPRAPTSRSQLFSWRQPGVLATLLLPLLALIGATLLRWPKRATPTGPDFVGLLAQLPPGDLAGAQALLRRLQAHRGRPPQDIPSDPSLWSDLQAARFGAGAPQALVERVRAAVRALEEGG